MNSLTWDIGCPVWKIRPTISLLRRIQSIFGRYMYREQTIIMERNRFFVNGCVIHVKSLEKHVEPQRNKIDLTPGQAGGN